MTLNFLLITLTLKTQIIYIYQQLKTNYKYRCCYRSYLTVSSHSHKTICICIELINCSTIQPFCFISLTNHVYFRNSKFHFNVFATPTTAVLVYIHRIYTITSGLPNCTYYLVSSFCVTVLYLEAALRNPSFVSLLMYYRNKR